MAAPARKRAFVSVGKQYLEPTLLAHFNVYPQDLERMFSYWLKSKHLQEFGIVLLQTYFAAKAGAAYNALAGVLPFAERVLINSGYKATRDYKKFFQKHCGGAGTKIAETFTNYLYENDPSGQFLNAQRYNRHAIAHGARQDSTYLDMLSGCVVVDTIISTEETNGKLLDRFIR